MKTTTIEKNLAESRLKGTKLLEAIDAAIDVRDQRRTELQAAQAAFEQAGHAISQGSAKETTIDRPRRELDIARAGFDLANRELEHAQKTSSDHRASEAVLSESLLASQRQDFVAAYLKKIDETQAAAKKLYKAISELYDLDNEAVIDSLGFQAAADIRNRCSTRHETPIREACQALCAPIFEFNGHLNLGLVSKFQQLKNGGDQACIEAFGEAHRDRLSAIFPKYQKMLELKNVA